ncbi:hypothetical protein Tco_0710985 [Tanacetum coccineum]
MAETMTFLHTTIHAMEDPYHPEGIYKKEPAPWRNTYCSSLLLRCQTTLAAIREIRKRVKSILLLANNLMNYLSSFTMSDAKSLWEAIKSRVYEDELKRSSSSNSASQNLAFLSSKNTGAYSFFVQPTTSPQLQNEDFQQMDGDDLEELDLQWQVAMLTVRVKKSGRNQGRRSYGDNGRSNAPTNESSSQELVAQDGLGGYDWSNDFEVEPVNYALIAISSSSSSSSFDNEVPKCSKQCLESFKTLQKNYDTEKEKHNKAKLEIKDYEIAIKSLESRILGHEKNELAWEKVVKERDELKDKIAKWEESTKNIDEILNNQISARDKAGLGYVTQLNELSSNHETDSENSQTNDANTKKPKSTSESVVSNPKIDRDKVIIEDWNSDDDEDVNEVQIVRPETQTVKTRDDKSGVLTRTGLHRPSVSTARPVCTARPSVSTARPVCTARPSISTARLSVSTARPICTARLMVRMDTDLKKSRWVWRPKGNYLDHVFKDNGSFMLKKGNPEILLQDHVVVDSGCSSLMTGNKAYLSDYEDYNRGFVAFGSNPKGGKITGKGKIRTTNLEFDDVYFVDELNVKLFDENQVVLKAPRQNGMYSFDLKNIVPSGAMDDVSRQAFEEEKRIIASQKKAAQATSTNKFSTDRSSVSTANMPYVSGARTSTGENAGESLFVYLGEKIPIDASTLPNADLPIDPNMPDLEETSDILPND